jgi:Zn-dependent M32 family carboxypeptidase
MKFKAIIKLDQTMREALKQFSDVLSVLEEDYNDDLDCPLIKSILLNIKKDIESLINELNEYTNITEKEFNHIYTTFYKILNYRCKDIEPVHEDKEDYEEGDI